MFKTVEFEFSGRHDEGAEGEIAVVHKYWMTPRKGHCRWPPRKFKNKINKYLVDGHLPDDSWKVFEIKRIFYETDSLAKAREKAKLAEFESEVNSSDHDKSARKRKKKRKMYNSSTSDNNSDSDDNKNSMVYPKPPATKLGEIHKQRECDKEISNSEKCRKQVAPEIHKQRECVRPTPLAFSTDEETSNSEKCQNIRSTPPSTDLSRTEIRSNSDEASLIQSLNVIAKHLARIERDIKDLQISQQEILIRVRSSTLTPLEHSLPDGITLPCDDNEALIKIETWIKTSNENGKLLITYLSLVGGNKIPVIIRRILKKLFTNKLAVGCNWTGKNTKTPLKDLELIKIIRDAVRMNQIAANATDAEIHEVISNWFRFTKDRNGGREARRTKQ